MKALAWITVLILCSTASAQTANFWGITFNSASTVYPPSVAPYPTFQTFRFWDTQTNWAQMQTGPDCQDNSGNCDFSQFDNWMVNQVLSPSHGIWNVIFTIGKTPNFVSSYKGDPNCQDSDSKLDGSCVPPTDLKCTGMPPGVAGTGGTDATFINFMEYFWSHVHQKQWDQIGQWYIEIWNEPDNPSDYFWDRSWIDSAAYCGSADQTASIRVLIRMAADAKQAINSVDPSNTVKFLTPPPFLQSSMQVGGWWGDYLSGGGGQYDNGAQFADVMSIHGYIGNQPVENICCGPETLVKTATTTMNALGINKPLFISEGSCELCTMNDPVAWTGSYYSLLLAGGQVPSFTWHFYDNGAGKMWDGQELTPIGTAVAVMQTDWGYQGAQFTGQCSSTPASCGGNFWTCPLIEGGARSGTQALTAWYDVSGSSCGFAPGTPGWVDYIDLTGLVTTFTGPVPLGNRPIMFEK